MSDFILVQTSVDTREGAQRVADTLIEQRLAACGWVSGPIASTYWWNGQIERSQEWVCTLKTRQDLFPAVEQAIKAVHPYEVPEIVATPLVAGSQDYLAWIAQETRPH